ncbi:restriction endonuclease subunit S [Acidiluteibacter ferrifornacis]|uniref:Restriction endonuclease subunit S n=1 Tax=Acidiluteibacter ferrifornacis TaxID=2692424 RepID=A0A6N9NK22_9FLAO|nr:restriction endonuclease subunit S [Acidiluteibacter ferrifornacis]NBG66209.1 restriction endonuclease subunit S [Acidiluteibacter ferrifornacis]
MGIKSWQKTPLKALCSRIGDGLHGTPTYEEDSNIFFINGNNLKHGKIELNENTKTVTTEDFERNYIELNQNTLLLGINGSIGSMAFYNNEKVMLGKSAAYLNFKSPINRFYFYYFQLKDVQQYFYNVATGSTIKNLSLKSIQDFEVPYPDKSEWSKIAKVLSDLDAKIELNNKINAELEGMAKLIYDYWFVQFNYPDKNGKPYKSSGGKMVFNDELKRDIPEGWEVVELQDIANITMGQSPPGDSYNEEGIGKVFYQGCTDFGSRFPTNRKFTTQPSRHALEGDILLSVRAPVGTMNIANEDCCIGRGLAALNSKIGSISSLDGVLRYLKQVFDRRNSDGTTFGSITKGDLFSLSVIKPHDNVLKKFNSIVHPMFEKQNKIGLENQQLSSLRDWLLPMLMNGQVLVKGAYEKMEEVELGVAAEGEGEYK